MGSPLTLSIGRHRTASGTDWVHVHEGDREVAVIGYEDRAGWLVIVGRRHIDWVDGAELVAWLRRQPSHVITIVAPHLPEWIIREATADA